MLTSEKCPLPLGGVLHLLCRKTYTPSLNLLNFSTCSRFTQFPPGHTKCALKTGCTGWVNRKCSIIDANGREETLLSGPTGECGLWPLCLAAPSPPPLLLSLILKWLFISCANTFWDSPQRRTHEGRGEETGTKCSGDHTITPNPRSGLPGSQVLHICWQ